VTPDLVLEDTPYGLQVYHGGRRLYGPRPAVDASRRVTTGRFDPGTLILWPSPVVWHGWSDLAARISAECAVIAVESDPVLLELARRHLPPDDPRLVLIPATPEEGVLALRRFGEHRLRRVVEITTTASALSNREAYRRIAAIVEREMRVFWQNRMTIAAMGRLWVRNTIANLPALPSSVPAPRLRGPAIVCGAGPSLDAAIDAIRGTRHLISLVAVDTALPILTGHGIIPDLVIALEGQIANLSDFLGADHRSYHLIADLTSAPTAARLHDRTSWTITRFAPFFLIDRLARLVGTGPSLPPLGSVGVAAVSLTAAMGASPIVCSGLDFAVRPGTTHARGAPSYQAAMARSDRLHPVPDPSLGARLITAPGTAGPVRTTLVLKGYADELAAIVGRRDDIYAMSPFGLSYAARTLAPEQLAVVATSAGTPRRGLMRAPAAREPRRPSGADVRRFIGEELDGLREYAGRSVEEDLPAFLDYLLCETPDQITSFADRVATLRPDQQTRRRLRVASDYYIAQWEAALRRIEHAGH
jgi:hypothetical protein